MLSEDLGKGNVAARQSRIKLQEVRCLPNQKFAFENKQLHTFPNQFLGTIAVYYHRVRAIWWPARATGVALPPGSEP